MGATEWMATGILFALVYAGLVWLIGKCGYINNSQRTPDEIRADDGEQSDAISQPAPLPRRRAGSQGD